MNHIPKAQKRELAKKQEKAKDQADRLQQAWEEVTKEKHKRSEHMLKHKLRKLEPCQIQQLHNMCIVEKINKKEIIDDLNIDAKVTADEESKVHKMLEQVKHNKMIKKKAAVSGQDGADGQDGLSGTNGKGGSGGSEKVFLIQRDREGLVKRLDHKFSRLANNAVSRL